MITASLPGRFFRLIVPCCLLAGAAIADGSNNGDSDVDSDDNSGDYLQLENCISTTRIRHTYIVDDRTIIFYMNQQKVFVNQLPYRCPGLRSARAFSYRLSVAALCNVDTITVTRTMGSGIETGPTCGLGKFRPVTREEAEMIRNKEIELPPLEPESAEDSDTSHSDQNDSDTGDSE